MAWECEACGHAPHGDNHGRGCLRTAEKQPPCGCRHVTDRKERAAEVMSNHYAPERNSELAQKLGQ